MEDSERPSIDLARRILPQGLLNALELIANQSTVEMMLVGGTALAGFYAGHRRSDDLDLFCKSNEAFVATQLAVKALSQAGVELSSEFSSGSYYKAVSKFQQHTFTIDVVLDSNIFAVGRSYKASGNLKIASLLTIIKMKSATLVSRASEKDLYDLIWLFNKFPALSLEEFIKYGTEIDGGVSGEAMLVSLDSKKLSADACGFVFEDKADSTHTFEQISNFKDELKKNLSNFLHKNKGTIELGEIVNAIRRFK